MKKFRNLLDRLSYLFLSKEEKIKNRHEHEVREHYKREISTQVDNLLRNLVNIEKKHLIDIAKNSDFLEMQNLVDSGYELTDVQLEKRDMLIAECFMNSSLTINALNDKQCIDILIYNCTRLELYECYNDYKNKKVKNKNVYELLKNLEDVHNNTEVDLTKELYLINLLKDKGMADLFLKSIIDYFEIVRKETTSRVDSSCNLIITCTSEEASKFERMFVVHKKLLDFICQEHYSDSKEKQIAFWQSFLKNERFGDSFCMKPLIDLKNEIQKTIICIKDGTYQTNKPQLSLSEKAKLIYEKPSVLLKKVNTEGLDMSMDDKMLLCKIKSIEKKVIDYLGKIENEQDKNNAQQLLTTLFNDSLKSYLSVDAEFRDTLKNENGQSAKDLLIKNLELVEHKFLVLKKDINEKRLDVFAKETRVNERVFDSLSG